MSDLEHSREVYERKDDIQIVDVREPYEWEAGRIEGAIHVPLNDLMAGQGQDRLDPVRVFGKPFAEPGPKCHNEKVQGQATKVCKPAAVSVVVLPNGRILYWDGLEGFENIKYGTAAEAGDAAVNDQSRLLSLDPN